MTDMLTKPVEREEIGLTRRMDKRKREHEVTLVEIVSLARPICLGFDKAHLVWLVAQHLVIMREFVVWVHATHELQVAGCRKLRCLHPHFRAGVKDWRIRAFVFSFFLLLPVFRLCLRSSKLVSDKDQVSIRLHALLACPMA